MGKKRERITTISLPHAVSERVGQILLDAGFEIGSIGGGECDWTRCGKLLASEQKRLSLKMAEVVFDFEVMMAE